MENFDNLNYIFFDLETTSLNVYDAHILEIGALYPNGTTTFHAYVRYPGLIDNSHIHGITQESLTINNARQLNEVLNDFETWIKARFSDQTTVYLVAHNCIGYDKQILEVSYKRIGRTMPSNWHFLDTLPQIKRLFRMPKYKLGAIYETFFREPLIGAHGAIADVRALYRVYLHAINEAFYRHDTPAIHFPQYSGMSRNVVGTALYSNFLLNDSSFVQMSVYDSRVLTQPVEILGVIGYPLQLLKTNGVKEVKDLLIMYLVVYPRFRSHMENEIGITSQYNITKLHNAIKYYGFVLYNAQTD